jgi:geranylgeranyl reductase family protein
MSYDVAIAGAGPAGLICGAELEKLGHNTIVIEKDNVVGEPEECAGLFNINGLKRLGIKKSDYVLNEVSGARFFAADGDVAEIKGKESKAYVVGRGEFDRFLAEQYTGELVMGREVKGARDKGKIYHIDAPGVAVEAENLVVATGHDPSLQKSLNLIGPDEFISTSQYEIKGMDIDTDFVELYLGSVAPGFFAWVIPTSESKARVGLGIIGGEKSTNTYMKEFLAKLKDEGKFKKDNKVVHKSGGLIPLFNPDVGPQYKRTFLVGDAAGHVKATTGGGVMIGGLAAKALAKAIHEGTPYAAGLVDIYKELKNHLLIRRVMNKFGDEQFAHMIEFLNNPDVKGMIEEHGDMDFAGPLINKAMKNPMLMMKAMKFMGGGLLF